MSEHPMIDPLVVQILEQNSKDLAYTTNALIESYRDQAETAQATLDAIREEVTMLLEGMWMPTPHAIEKALWPSEEYVNRMREK